MTVFIGWSGKTSREITLILREWLAGMFGNRIAFVAETDTARGMDWRDALTEMMSSADCALLCVTADNVNSPWLAYEAGALSQSVKSLIPVLFGVSPSRLSGPFQLFPFLRFNSDGMRELTARLNQLCAEDGLSAQELEQTFQARYPVAERFIKAILSEVQPQPDDLEEKLDAILSRLSEIERNFPPRLNREAAKAL